MPTPPTVAAAVEASGAVVPQPAGHPSKELAQALPVSADKDSEPTSEPKVRRAHVRSLDGVRGIAILAVFLFHCSLRLRGRWELAAGWGW